MRYLIYSLCGAFPDKLESRKRRLPTEGPWRLSDCAEDGGANGIVMEFLKLMV